MWIECIFNKKKTAEFKQKLFNCVYVSANSILDEIVGKKLYQKT